MCIFSKEMTCLGFRIDKHRAFPVREKTEDMLKIMHKEL